MNVVFCTWIRAVYLISNLRMVWGSKLTFWALALVYGLQDFGIFAVDFVKSALLVNPVYLQYCINCLTENNMEYTILKIHS